MSGRLPGGSGRGRRSGLAHSFIGRQAELAQLRQLLDGESRLVTLSGLGGAGKARMAAELARGFVANHPDPPTSTVWWVPLTSVRGPALVPGAVAGALRLALSAAASADDLLVRRLSEESTLLVLELRACGGGLWCPVSVLLTRCPQLRVLTTSRTPLGLSGEQVFPVPPMTSSKQDSGAAASDAFDLFVCRAHLVAPAGSVNSGDPAIAESPSSGWAALAIELAAGWIDCCHRAACWPRSREVRRCSPPSWPTSHRHQNMTGVLTRWRSFDFGQQRVLAGLAIFAGSFTTRQRRPLRGHP